MPFSSVPIPSALRGDIPPWILPDRRPLKCVKHECVENLAAGQVYEVLNVTGSGCLRKLWSALWAAHPWVEPDVRGNDELLNGRWKFYFDGEDVPSIDVTTAALIFAEVNSSFQFTHRLVARTSYGNSVPPGPYVGFYNNFAMPFTTGCRVTFTAPEGGIYRFYCQLYYNHDASGAIRPDYGRYSRLRCEYHENVVVPGMTFHNLLERLNAHKKGAILATSLTYYNQNDTVMEGNVEVYLDGEGTPSLQSSGTEDWFYGAWYWANTSQYWVGDDFLKFNPLAGWLAFTRFCDHMPIVYDDTIMIRWENGEARTGSNPGNTTVYTSVWYYEES